MSLLNPEITSWIGRSIQFESEAITTTEVRRFIAASDDPNPAYADGSGLAPPMLYYGATRPFVSDRELAEDGTVFEHRPMIGKGQSMGGSVEVEWIKPLRVGDQLTGVRTLASLNEKLGSKLHFVVATWVTEYFGADGELAIRETYEQILF